jgi:FixJ family two-component response regulator
VNPTPVVYIVDDDPSVSQALVRVVRVAGFRPAAFPTARSFLDHPALESPACLVLDVQLPDQDGLDLQKELKKRNWALPIVFLSGHASISIAVEAMRAGAVHFLPKPCDNRELLAAIRQALDLGDRQQARAEEIRRIGALVKTLTPREREVLLLASAGLANKNIAARLGVCLQTVKLHRGHVMQKLRLESVAELVHFAEKAAPFLPDSDAAT